MEITGKKKTVTVRIEKNKTDMICFFRKKPGKILLKQRKIRKKMKKAERNNKLLTAEKHC